MNGEKIYMNWKNCAIEDLTEYASLKTAVLNLKSRLESVKIKNKTLSAVNLEKIGGGRGRYDMGILNSIVELSLIEENLKMAEKRLESTERSLNSLRCEDRRILLELYVNRPPKQQEAVDRLCEKLCCENSSVYRKREAALCRFTLAQYGNVGLRM